jgi:hypothetical protein
MKGWCYLIVILQALIIFDQKSDDCNLYTSDMIAMTASRHCKKGGIEEESGAIMYLKCNIT